MAAGDRDSAADALLEELTARYTVERRESKELLTAGSDGPFVRVVRLIPHTPAAAPLSVVFNELPSVILRLGRWYEQSLPDCGCDACDEDPAELVGEVGGGEEAVVGHDTFRSGSGAGKSRADGAMAWGGASDRGGSRHECRPCRMAEPGRCAKRTI